MEFLIAIPAFLFMVWLLHKAFKTFKQESNVKESYMNLSGSQADAKQSLNEDKSEQNMELEGMMMQNPQPFTPPDVNDNV